MKMIIHYIEKGSGGKINFSSVQMLKVNTNTNTYIINVLYALYCIVLYCMLSLFFFFLSFSGEN